MDMKQSLLLHVVQKFISKRQEAHSYTILLLYSPKILLLIRFPFGIIGIIVV